MNRAVRLGLAAAFAVVASAPLTTPASASACNDQMFPEVCAAISAACQSTKPTQTVCGLFQ
jgi:hypothetical protein